MRIRLSIVSRDDDQPLAIRSPTRSRIRRLGVLPLEQLRRIVRVRIELIELRDPSFRAVQAADDPFSVGMPSEVRRDVLARVMHLQVRLFRLDGDRRDLFTGVGFDALETQTFAVREPTAFRFC